MNNMARSCHDFTKITTKGQPGFLAHLWADVFRFFIRKWVQKQELSNILAAFCNIETIFDCFPEYEYLKGSTTKSLLTLLLKNKSEVLLKENG